MELQSLDKEDALVCFEEHICMLEQEHDEEKERERRKQKRIQRKNREAFIVLLDELHEQKLLSSTSMWKDLYSIISRSVNEPFVSTSRVYFSIRCSLTYHFTDCWSDRKKIKEARIVTYSSLRHTRNAATL